MNTRFNYDHLIVLAAQHAEHIRNENLIEKIPGVDLITVGLSVPLLTSQEAAFRLLNGRGIPCV